MNDLPRRDPAPLYPKPGSFEETLRRARRRRQRSAGLAAAALVVVCVGGVAGAMTLTGDNSPSNFGGGPVASQTTTGPGSSTESTAPSGTVPTTTPTTGGSSTGSSPSGSTGHSGPGGSATSSSGFSSSASSNPPPSDTGQSGAGHGPMYAGRAVNAAGRPLSNIGVYVQRGGTQVKVATTSADGSFQAPCTEGPVLLATGNFAGAGGSSGQNYAYTYVDTSGSAASCSTAPKSSHAAATVMSTGGRLTVTVTDGSGDPVAGSTEPALYCDAAATTPCYTMTADSAGSYTYTGLPTGDYTLRGAYASKTFHVTAGETTNVPWVEGQTPVATPTSPSPTSPTTTPSPSQGGGTTSSQAPDTTAPQTQSGQTSDGNATGNQTTSP